MDEHILVSSRDAVLVAIPIVLMLLMSIFRLDQTIATPKGCMNRRRPPCGIDDSGQPVLRDPDGRLSGPDPGRKRSVRPQ